MKNNLLSFDIFVSETTSMPLLSTDDMTYMIIHMMVPVIAHRDPISY